MSVLGLTWNIGSLGLGAAPVPGPGATRVIVPPPVVVPPGVTRIIIPPPAVAPPPPPVWGAGAGVGAGAPPPTIGGAAGGVPPNGLPIGTLLTKATPFPASLPPPLTVTQMTAEVSAAQAQLFKFPVGTAPAVSMITGNTKTACQAAINTAASLGTNPTPAAIAAADRAARLAALAVKCRIDAIAVVSAVRTSSGVTTALEAQLLALHDVAGSASVEACFLAQDAAVLARAGGWLTKMEAVGVRPPTLAQAAGRLVKASAKFTIAGAPFTISGHDAEFQILVPLGNLSGGDPPPPAPPSPGYLGIIGIINGISPAPSPPPLPGPNQYIRQIQAPQSAQQAQQAQQPGSQTYIINSKTGTIAPQDLQQQQMQQIQAQQDQQAIQSRQQYIQQQQAILNQQSILQNQRSFALSQALQTDLQEDIVSMLELIAFGTSDSDVQLMLSKMRNGARIQGLLGLSLGLAGPPSAGFTPIPSSLPPTPR